MRWLVLFLVIAAFPAQAEVVNFEVTSTQSQPLRDENLDRLGSPKRYQAGLPSPSIPSTPTTLSSSIFLLHLATPKEGLKP